MKRILAIICAVFLTSCATTTTSLKLGTPPVLSPFGDGRQWVVMEDMDFQIILDDDSVTSIRVPRGFVSDLASTPKLIWSLYSPSGRYLSASILHDYLYWQHSCGKEQADKILYQTMGDAGVNQKTQSHFYSALERYGMDAWRMNMVEKEVGLIRVIPDEFLKKRKAEVTWNSYRKSLFKDSVKEDIHVLDESISEICTKVASEITVKTGFFSWF